MPRIKRPKEERGREKTNNKDNKEFRLSWKKVFLFVVVILIIIYALASLFKEASDKIMVIPIKGTLTLEGEGFLFFEQPSTISFINQCLDSAEKDVSVKAVILEINSPGGEVVASSRVGKKVSEVKESKPIVAQINDVGASGAYWIAASSSRIVADPFSLVGSIGVTSGYLEFGGLLSKLNITYERLVVGEHKDITTPYRKLTPEEEKIILEKLKLVHEEFLKVVAENRNLTDAQVREVSSGLFYLGKEAKDLGLVDVLGDQEDAEKLAKELAGIDEETELLAQRCSHPRGFFFGPSREISNYFYFLGRGIGAELTKFSSTATVPKITAA